MGLFQKAVHVLAFKDWNNKQKKKFLQQVEQLIKDGKEVIVHYI